MAGILPLIDSARRGPDQQRAADRADGASRNPDHTSNLSIGIPLQRAMGRPMGVVSSLE